MANLQASVSITVPALQDNAVWFQNANAWSNYWKLVTADVTINPIENTLYVPVAYVDTDKLEIVLGGTVYKVVSQEAFDSLKNKLDALELSYRQLRTDLKDGGLIANSQ